MVDPIAPVMHMATAGILLRRFAFRARACRQDGRDCCRFSQASQCIAVASVFFWSR